MPSCTFLAIGQQNSCVVNDAYHSSNLALNKAQCDKNHSQSLDIRLFPIVESFARFISEKREYVVEESQNWRRSNLSYQENKEWSFYCSLHWQWPAWWEELRVTLLSKNLTRSLKKDDQAHSFIHLSQDFLFFQASIRSAAEVDAFGSFWYGPNQLFLPYQSVDNLGGYSSTTTQKGKQKKGLELGTLHSNFI